MKAIFWVFVLAAWSFVEIFYMMFNAEPSNTSKALLKNLRNSLWTRDELILFEVRRVHRKYQSVFMILDLDFEGYKKLIKMRDLEIEKAKQDL